MQYEVYKDGFLLGEWRVHPMQGELRGPSGLQHIEPKVMKFLVCLARHDGRVVDRDTLIREVWDGRVVSDEALFRCVADLRKRLGDSRKEPRYIRTVHKIGYQLVSPVYAANKSGANEHAAVEGTIEHWPYAREFDDLDIIRLLGSGLMAHVHLAREIPLQRLVAVKTLRPSLNMSDNARRRFQREAQAAARLAHPNVTALYRIGELPHGVPYIVQQYVDGYTLADMLELEGPPAVDKARALLFELAGALAAAHDRRIIHRDLKPGNVLIEKESGQALLTDFGIAGIQETGRNDATRLTLAGEMLGEPRYVSPEQIRGEKATSQSDVYSFGLVAFEVLTGRYAYEFTEPFDATKVHLQSEALPFAEHGPNVPEALQRLVERCLDKDPRRRPSAEQLHRLLERDAAPEPVVQSEGQLSIGSRSHKRWVMGLLAAVTLLTIAWVLVF